MRKRSFAAAYISLDVVPDSRACAPCNACMLFCVCKSLACMSHHPFEHAHCAWSASGQTDTAQARCDNSESILNQIARTNEQPAGRIFSKGNGPCIHGKLHMVSCTATCVQLRSSTCLNWSYQGSQTSTVHCCVLLCLSAQCSVCCMSQTLIIRERAMPGWGVVCSNDNL
jgi:hypothetical protein